MANVSTGDVAWSVRKIMTQVICYKPYEDAIHGQQCQQGAQTIELVGRYNTTEFLE